MKINYSSFKIRFVAIVMLITTVAIGFSGAFFYFSLERSLREKNDAHLKEYVGQVNELLNDRLESVNTLALLLISNSSLRAALLEEYHTAGEKVEKVIRIENRLKQQLLFDAAWHEKLIDSVYVFVSAEESYGVQRHTVGGSDFENNLRVFSASRASPGATSVILPEYPGGYLYITYVMSDLSTGAEIATLVVAVRYELFDILGSLDSSYNSIMLSVYHQDRLIFQKNGNADAKLDLSGKWRTREWSYGEFYKFKYDGSSFLAQSNTLSRYGLYSVLVIPENEAFADLRHITANFILIIAVLLLGLLLLGGWIAAAFVKPIDKVLEVVSEIGQGHFDVRVEPSGFSEFDRLADTVNGMAAEINRLINEVYEKKLSSKEAELKFLLAQINPHFLFNALECITWQATMRGEEELSEMVWSLGQLLRAGIYMKEDEKITIREELEYINFYLYLQKVRFGDKLQTDIRVDDDRILDMLVPKLCIQCIVENAVVHGLENKRGAGVMSLHAQAVDDRICIRISDNGVGFDVSTLYSPEGEMTAPSDGGRSHIGIYNTDKRLRLFYGEEYGLTIQSVRGEGTEVLIVLPGDNVEGCDV